MEGPSKKTGRSKKILRDKTNARNYDFDEDEADFHLKDLILSKLSQSEDGKKSEKLDLEKLFNKFESGGSNDTVPKQLKFTGKGYDPYAFLDAMATPFDIPGPKKQGSSDNNGTKAEGTERAMPHCKACTDFKTWMQLTANPRRNMTRKEREDKECPLDSELLGRNTWSFLHTMAAYFPEKPTTEQETNMVKFINLFSHFYPCHKCASHLREELKHNTPDTRNNTKLSEWFCELHNTVNVRLGKPEFDCSKVLERWRDGWEDKSCD